MTNPLPPFFKLSERFLSRSGIVLGSVVVVLVILNQYGPLTHLDARYRITTSALCLVFTTLLTAISIRTGLMGLMFALPLQPALAWQIQQYFGYGRILGIHNSGLDLVAGFCLGALLNGSWRGNKLRDLVKMPWPVGLAFTVITLSVGVAISRNLTQTSSTFSGPTLLYNLLHLRSLGWHDDYRPLFDWIAYGCAFSLIAVLIPILNRLTNREHYIFLPLMVGLIIAAIVGIRQSFFAIGFTEIQRLFRSEHFGFMALGFQDDIHAFAGQMLIGAIGLFGYIYALKKTVSRWAIALTVVPLTWWAMFLSKSKTTFLLAILALLLLTIIWVFRHSKYFQKIAISSITLLTIFLLCGLFFQEPWIKLISKGLQWIGVNDLEAFNLKLSYRPEVYLAGLKMFSLFPFFGMGQSEYYRQAANYDLTGSYFLSIQQNGENGHNYFLQTLVETGIVGGLVFLVMLLYPLFKTQDKHRLIPGGLALIAILIGNVFAHSLLVRENLMVAAVMLGLLYASVTSLTSEKAATAPVSKVVKTPWLNEPLFMAAFGLCFAFTLGGSIRELYKASASFPFTVDTQCFKKRPLDRDGWTAGVLDIPIDEKTKRVTFNLRRDQILLEGGPFDIEISVRNVQEKIVLSKLVSLMPSGLRSFSVDIPDDVAEVAHEANLGKKITLRLPRCFIPRNLGINDDSRRLGIQIDSITTY